MAGDTRLASFLELTTALLFIVSIQKTHGSKCRPDWCNYNEYCCGIDECCSYLTGYWLLGGVMIFSFLMVCCWMRHRQIKSPEYQKLKSPPRGYVMYGVTDYGEPIYVHQQPSDYHYGQSPTRAPYISTSVKGDIPLQEATQRQSVPEQPPPYDYTDRRTPTAPPLNR